jgi:hypothetical protein
MNIVKKVATLIIGLSLLLLGLYSSYFELTMTHNDMNMQVIWFKTLGSWWIFVNVFLIVLGAGLMFEALSKGSSSDATKAETVDTTE